MLLALARDDRRPSEVEVKQVMTARVHACRPDDDMREALGTMRERRVRRLPVVSAGGELVGLLSLDDVVLQARALETADFSGPFYLDIAETLKAINQHLVPAVPQRPTARTRPAGRKGARRREPSAGASGRP
jgi:signal-transduction protein with cAMP-binding, CBS, and nucleotidyltransferase domain